MEHQENQPNQKVNNPVHDDQIELEIKNEIKQNQIEDQIEQTKLNEDEDALYRVPDFTKDKNTAMKKLAIVATISILFMISEVVGGYYANSLAIMSDAAHILQDIIGFLISIFSICISKRPANTNMSYGYHRAEIVGALGSMIFIWGITAWLVYEAVERIINPEGINGLLMLIIAILGFLFNLLQFKILHSHNHSHNHSHSHEEEQEEDSCDHHDEKEGEQHNHNHNKKIKQIKSQSNDTQNKQNEQILDVQNNNVNQSHKEDKDKKESQLQKQNDNKKQNSMNIRAALIHVIGDTLQSVGVIIASLFLYFGGTQFEIADPICTILFSVIVIFTTIPVTKDCIIVLMEGSPISIKMEKLKNKILKIEDVVDIHDFHVWSLSAERLALSAHIISKNPSQTMKQATWICKEFNIYHSTLQVENSQENNIYNSQKCAINQLCNTQETKQNQIQQ